jgi:DNA-binding MarR family transcriptional regulator
LEPWQVPAEHVKRVLRFNRLYGDRIFAEIEAMQVNEMTWTQWRVLRELGEAPEGRTLAWLRDKLRVDAANLCRIVQLFGHHGFVRTYPWPIDRRIRAVDLTDWGRRTFRTLERSCDEHAREGLQALTRGDQRRLVRAMAAIEEVLSRP